MAAATFLVLVSIQFEVNKRHLIVFLETGLWCIAAVRRDCFWFEKESLVRWWYSTWEFDHVSFSLRNEVMVQTWFDSFYYFQFDTLFVEVYRNSKRHKCHGTYFITWKTNATIILMHITYNTCKVTGNKRKLF